MDLDLKNKVALVTGSTDGIGNAIAKSLVSEGCIVYINGRSQKSVNAAITQLEKENHSGELRPAPYDLSSPEETQALFNVLSSVDILVNNLGIYEVKSFENITDDDWKRIFDINVLSGIRLSRHFFPKMLEKNWGRIIFISSESAVNIPSEMIHYGVTKTAQLGVARGLAELTVGTKVTVNSVLPGPTFSRGVKEYVSQVAQTKGISSEQVVEDFFKQVRPNSLLQRFETPEEIASVVAFLCSQQASAVNGTALRAEGGLLRSVI